MADRIEHGENKRHGSLLNRLSLRSKLMLSYLIVGFLPLLIAGGFLLQRANGVIEDQSVRTLGVSMEQLCYNINTQLAGYKRLADIFYFDPELDQLLQRDYSGSSTAEIFEAESQFIGRLKAHLKVRGDIRNITVYHSNSRMIHANPYLIYKPDLPGASRLRELGAKASEGFWATTRELSATNLYWTPDTDPRRQDASLVLAYNRVLDFFSTASGMLTVEVKENDLSRLLEKESRDKMIYLLNEDGNVLTSSERSQIGGPFPYGDVLRQFEGKRTGTFGWKHAGSSYVVAHRMTDNGWQLVYLAPKDVILEQTRAMERFGIVLLAASLLISVLLIYLFSGLIVSRLKVLLKRINRMKEGDIQTGQLIEGSDEIAVIDRQYSRMAERIKYLIDEVYVLTIKKKEAELTALQNQINPHFLYNTLSTISWLARKDGSAATVGIVENLAAFYRISLSKGKEIIPLRDELACIRAYVDIQRVRFRGQLRVLYAVEEDLLDTPVLKLVLQPIVENAIVHGLDPEKGRLTILIKGYPCGDDMCLEIRDDGRGIEGRTLSDLLETADTGAAGAARGGYGLRNVNERIGLHFGAGYRLAVESEPGRGTTVRMVFPYGGAAPEQQDRFRIGKR